MHDSVQELIHVMARLRDPENGCPWDLEQDFSTIAPYTVEEAFEVAEAIAAGDMEELCEELGDLLFQVVFHARMAEEAGHFRFEDVARAIVDKMVRRHPHVFGDETDRSHEQLHRNWEAAKAEEHRAKGRERDSLLDGIPSGLPALQRAVKFQKKAARVGFDWPQRRQVLQQVRAELEELEEAMEREDPASEREELGDLLFTMANLSRHLRQDPEMALRESTHKFEQRFRAMESMAAEADTSLHDLDADALEALWERAKDKG